MINVNTGISDFHHLIGFSKEFHFPRKLRKEFVYRSYRNFDELEYKQDMSVIPYHVVEIFDDIDDQCWFTQKLISYVIDIHAPCKRRRAVKNPVPFMNSKLRKICHKKAMLSNRYYKNGRQKHDWEEFRKIRNLATKLKAKSMNAFSIKIVTGFIKTIPGSFEIP